MAELSRRSLFALAGAAVAMPAAALAKPAPTWTVTGWPRGFFEVGDVVTASHGSERVVKYVVTHVSRNGEYTVASREA